MERWQVSQADPSEARALSRALELHPLLARILVARGLHDPESARRFLFPKLAELTNPDAMADRSIAADRLHRAIEKRERIVVFGDYDVDGTTSAALLTLGLRAMGANVTAMSASRFDGGYGLSDSAVDKVLLAHPTLVVTCDCGTSDHPRLERLRERSIDAIVVDHHLVPEQALPAMAFLNPHRPECGFPYKGLASVGLALSLVAAVRARRQAKLDLREYLDLVAVGTIADVAPLTGDNRILTRAGLERLDAGTGRPGFRALLAHARTKGTLRAQDIAFSIAPLLNAPGRLGPPTATLKLLLAREEAEAAELARELVIANETRRQLTAELIAKAIAQVEEVYGESPPAGLVVAGQGWHPGVGGIVAARLVERFEKPVLFIALEGETGVGSARAPKGTALFGLVSACREVLEKFGGHDAAAGLTVRTDRLEALRAAFSDACAAAKSNGVGTSGTQADAALTEVDLTGPLAAQLPCFEPTGQEQPEPTVLIQQARVLDARPVGTGHLRVRYAIGRAVVGAFFRDGVLRRSRGEVGLQERSLVDLLARLRPDPWSGPTAVQLDVLTARIA